MQHRKMNGHSQQQWPPIAPESIMLHLVASTARLEAGQDHIHQRLERVELKIDQPPSEPRRHLTDYMPVAYGLAVLAAVVTGKMTVLQGLSIFKGGLMWPRLVFYGCIAASAFVLVA